MCIYDIKEPRFHARCQLPVFALLVNHSNFSFAHCRLYLKKNSQPVNEHHRMHITIEHPAMQCNKSETWLEKYQKIKRWEFKSGDVLNVFTSRNKLYLKDLWDGSLYSKLGKNSKLPHSDRNELKQAAAPPLCRIKTLAIPAVTVSYYLTLIISIVKEVKEPVICYLLQLR